MSSSNRIEWIDILKGFAAIFVILGHALHTTWFKTWIYLFHLGLFFFASGYLLNVTKYRSAKIFAVRKVRTVVLPYIQYSLLIVIFMIFWEFFKNDGSSIYDILNHACLRFVSIFVQMRGTVFQGYCWFLPVLFLAECLFFVLYRFLSDRVFLFHFVILLLFSIGYLYQSFIHISLLWNVDLVFIIIPIIDFGYICRTYNLSFNNLCYAVGALFISIGFSIYQYNSFFRVDIFENSIGNPVAFLLGNIVGIYFFCSIAVLIRNNILLSYIGKNSIRFYTLHRPIVFYPVSLVLSHCLSSFHYNNEIIELYLVPLALSIISVVIIYVICFLLGFFSLKCNNTI